ncbi:MAG: mechanosensitive ion channel family protein [Chloroflexota bacterium]
MPTFDVDQSNALIAFLREKWFVLVFWTIVLLIAYRLARPFVHRLVLRLTVRATSRADGELADLSAAEAEKRAVTIEELISKTIRLGVLVVAFLVVLTIFDLFPVVAGLGLVAAALTLAGQSIVLDYLMGVLILVEGQYFIGDWIAVVGVEGTVEEVNLRRTVIRDASGTVHSVSNGLIRTSSNLTRMYAGLNLDVIVAYDTDIDLATAVVDRVGREMAADPQWTGRLIDVPTLIRVGALGDLGITLKIGGRVKATDRWAAPGEFRKRLLAAFNAEGIRIARRGTVVVGLDPAGGTVAVDPTDLDGVDDPDPGTGGS